MPIPPHAYYALDVVFDFNALGVEGERVRLKDSWDDVSPRLVVDYSVTPDVMVFGSLAKGYKAGGFNSVQPLSTFNNEDVWNAEGGVKSLFSDLGLIVNASAFYYVYQDKQSIRLVCPEDAVCQYVVDSSDDEAYGLDVDARWQPMDALTFTATLEWIDATYKKYITPPPESLDLSANRRANREVGRRSAPATCGRSRLRQARSVGDARVSRRITLQRRLRAAGHVPGQPELQGRRGQQSHRRATCVVERRR